MRHIPPSSRFWEGYMRHIPPSFTVLGVYMRHIPPPSWSWECSMRLMVHSSMVLGGQYAPHCTLFHGPERAVCASLCLSTYPGIPTVVHLSTHPGIPRCNPLCTPPWYTRCNTLGTPPWYTHRCAHFPIYTPGIPTVVNTSLPSQVYPGVTPLFPLRYTRVLYLSGVSHGGYTSLGVAHGGYISGCVTRVYAFLYLRGVHPGVYASLCLRGVHPVYSLSYCITVGLGEERQKRQQLPGKEEKERHNEARSIGFKPVLP